MCTLARDTRAPTRIQWCHPAPASDQSLGKAWAVTVERQAARRAACASAARARWSAARAVKQAAGRPAAADRAPACTCMASPRAAARRRGERRLTSGGDDVSGGGTEGSGEACSGEAEVRHARERRGRRRIYIIRPQACGRSTVQHHGGVGAESLGYENLRSKRLRLLRSPQVSVRASH